MCTIETVEMRAASKYLTSSDFLVKCRGGSNAVSVGQEKGGEGGKGGKGSKGGGATDKWPGGAIVGGAAAVEQSEGTESGEGDDGESGRGGARGSMKR